MDDAETVQRIKDFIDAIWRKAETPIAPPPYPGTLVAPRSGRLSEQGLYLRCVGDLLPDERAELVRIIDKMAQVLRQL